MKFGFDWPSGFRGEDVSLYMYIIAPGQGQATPQGLKFYININLLSICFKFYPLNSILPFFPIQMHWRPKLTLPLNRSRSS